jgi:hypothetical protein
VVLQESIRIAFSALALNNLNVFVLDIGNAYLNPDFCKKVNTNAGPQFGSYAGKYIVIT